MPDRVAIVQHGDYRDAMATIASGQPETYYGMDYSLETIRTLVSGCEHLIVSLNASEYSEQYGTGIWLGTPPVNASRVVPGRLLQRLRARRITRELARFRPTRLLLRTGGELGRLILSLVAKHRIDTLVMLASMFNASGTVSGARLARRLSKELNRDHVWRVGNHRRPATRSMIRYGLHESKAIAWDWPTRRRPGDYPVKRLRQDAPIRVFYAGALLEDKGITDLVQAVTLLVNQGVNIELLVAGTGPEEERVRSASSELPIRVLGRVSNQTVFSEMIAATVVCVPSRHSFSEGMPLTLTEALASRTPVVVSDHPVLHEGLVGSAAHREFKASDPEDLAKALADLTTDAEEYHSKSSATEAAFDSLECKTEFGALLFEWRATWD